MNCKSLQMIILTIRPKSKKIEMRLICFNINTLFKNIDNTRNIAIRKVLKIRNLNIYLNDVL